MSQQPNFVIYYYLSDNILIPGSGRRGTGLTAAPMSRSGGRSGRRQPGSTAGPHSGQSANSGESLGDDDDDM